MQNQSCGKNPDVPENEKGLVFLLQGDSITDGLWGQVCSPERSLADGNHFLGHGYVYILAARIGADFPQAGFVFHNRGMSGHKVSDLEKRWDTDALALKPDVVSILVGINDTYAVIRKEPDACDAEVFEAKYRRLLQLCKEANPNVLFILGVPFIYPIGVHKENWNLWDRETSLRGEAVKRIAKDFDAVLVDYPRMFAEALDRAPIEHWTWDGCHPSVPGHELMAREWIRQAASRLSFLRYY
jgi:lysophospholipase L1-like esterase